MRKKRQSLAFLRTSGSTTSGSDNAKQSYGPPSDAALWFHRFSVILDNDDGALALEPWSPPKPQSLTTDQLAPIEAAIKAGLQEGIPWSPKLCSEGRSVRHLLVAQGITTTKAQTEALEALKTECGMVQAEYQARDANRNRKNWKQGLRIGSLPKAEWEIPENFPDAPDEIGGTLNRPPPMLPRCPQIRPGEIAEDQGIGQKNCQRLSLTRRTRSRTNTATPSGKASLTSRWLLDC